MLCFTNRQLIFLSKVIPKEILFLKGQRGLCKQVDSPICISVSVKRGPSSPLSLDSLHNNAMLRCRQSPARTAQSCPGSQVDFMKQREPWANMGSGSGLVVVLVFSLKHISYSHVRYNRARSTNPGLPCSSLPLRALSCCSDSRGLCGEDAPALCLASQRDSP